MITVKIEVNSSCESRLMVVRAGSIEQAISHAEEKYAGCSVRVVFPLDPDNFFVGDANVGASLAASEWSGTG